MTRRIKQVAYGSFYIVFLFTVVYGIYIATLKPPASCFDQKMNQDETEIDCGGQFCESCDIRRLLPIEGSLISVFPAPSDNTAIALIEFKNLNSTYGATSFTYHIGTYEGTSFIYPSEVKQKTLVNLPFAPDAITNQVVTISDVKWLIAESLSIPRIQVSRVNLDNGIITGNLKNVGSFPILNATVNGFVEARDKKIVGAGRTLLRDLAPSEERSFQIVVPLPAGFEADAGTPRVSVEAQR